MNRWLLPLSLLVASSFCGPACFAQKGVVRLFNGQDLTGWKGDLSRWSVEDGAITGQTTADNLLNYNTFLIWEGGEPADFVLRLQYRIVGGNSGVQYRSRVIDDDKFVVRGYQADIDSQPRFSGMNYEEKGRRFLAQRGQSTVIAPDGEISIVGSLGDKGALQAKIKNEDWNRYRIVARGNRLRHFINGVLMSEVVDKQSDHAASSGVIALQLHQGPPMKVQFRRIRLKEL